MRVKNRRQVACFPGISFVPEEARYPHRHGGMPGPLFPLSAHSSRSAATQSFLDSRAHSCSVTCVCKHMCMHTDVCTCGLVPQKHTWAAAPLPLRQCEPPRDPGLYGTCLALAGVGQWIEFQPANQRVVGSIPSWRTRLGFRPGPQ